jgi:FixJ family two-component response regulator
VARAVKATAPAIPVVLLTGWGEQPSIRPTDPGLVDRILAKPVRLADLLTAIHKLTIKRADHPAESAQFPD